MTCDTYSFDSKFNALYSLVSARRMAALVFSSSNVPYLNYERRLRMVLTLASGYLEPYSPRIQAMTCISASGIFGFFFKIFR